jgi:pimeloyl-ACP methyl ester carboxylesterase
MKRGFVVFFVLVVGMINVARAEETFLEYGRFGRVSLYQGSSPPSHVVLFVSGDGGWNLGVVDMARELATLNALVVGIDIIHFLRELGKSGEPCSNPAADFEMLNKFVQKKLKFSRYIVPVLVGYSSGATLVYAALAQGPPNTFCGAISLGFCPDLLLTKPLCKGHGLEWKIGPKGKGYIFLPATNLQDPWIALQGTIDQVCDPTSTEDYVKQVKGGEIVILPKVGHGFSVPKNWMPQFKKAFLRIVAQDKTAQPRESELITFNNLSPVEMSPVIVRRSSKAIAFAPIRQGSGRGKFSGPHTLITEADKE